MWGRRFAAAYVAERGPIAIQTLVDPAVAILGAAMARLSPVAQHMSVQARIIERMLAVARQDVVLCADPVAALRHLRSVLSPSGSILLVPSKPTTQVHVVMPS